MVARCVTVHTGRMEWLWVVLLFVILLGPPIVLLVRRSRGEKLTQAPDELTEAYRVQLDEVLQRKP